MTTFRHLAFMFVALSLIGLCASPATADENAQEQASAEQKSAASNPGLLLYGRYGWGWATRNEEETPSHHDDGPAVGMGLRYEHGHFGLDLSGFNILFNTPEYGPRTMARALAMYISSPDKTHSAYAGAGLGWGASTVYFGGTERGSENVGLQGQAVIGYSVLRTSPFRLFVEGEAVLPFYEVESNSSVVDGSRWAPHFSLSLGAAVDFLRLF